MDFIGTGRRLGQGDVGNAAREIDLPTAALLSIIEVETGGRGFDNKNRPLILPEPHKFFANLGAGAKRDRAVREGLAYKSWGSKPYPKSYDARYAQLAKMISIDENAALQSTSWALPQILGSNAEDSGYTTALALVKDFLKGEFEQLQAMCRLIVKWGIDKTIRNKDLTKAANWRAFAKRYNGSGYATHNYHGRLAAAFLKHSAGAGMTVATQRTVLKKGVKGEAVRNFQLDLIIAGYELGTADGRFGDMTDAATRLFQEANGLTVDGKAGTATLKALSDIVAAIGTDTTPKPVWDGQEVKAEPVPVEVEEEVEVEVEPEPDLPKKVEDVLAGDHITEKSAVLSVQNRLRDLGYTEVGTPDGNIGTFTETAIIAFRTDNKLPLEPVIDAPFLLALMTAKPRQLSPTRTEATPAEVREKVPESKSNWFAKIGAMWATGFAIFASVANGIFENIGPAKELFAPIANILVDVPIWVYLLLLAAAAGAIWYNSQKAGSKIIAAFQSGERR